MKSFLLNERLEALGNKVTEKKVKFIIEKHNQYNFKVTLCTHISDYSQFVGYNHYVIRAHFTVKNKQNWNG